MPDINYHSWSGPGSRRRIVAMCVLLLGLAGGWAYQRFMPKRYTSNMSFLSRSGRQDETRELLAASVRKTLSAENAPVCDINIDTVSAHVINVTCTTVPQFMDNSESKIILDSIVDTMRNQYNAMQKAKLRQMQGEQQELLEDIKSSHAKNWPVLLDNSEIFTTLELVLKGETEAPVNWMESVAGDSAAQTAARMLDNMLQQSNQTVSRIIALQAREKSLASWVNSPQNQTVVVKVKRVVHYEDTPELIKLKDRKAEIEASRMRLLQRATSAHPLARKMANEIEELNVQINALTRLPKVVEDVEQKSNPSLPQWRRELAGVRSKIAADKALLAQIHKQFAAQLAQLRVRWQQVLAQDKANKEAVLKSKLDKAAVIPVIEADEPFTIYSPAKNPVAIKAVEPVVAYLIGGAVGLFAAILLLIGRRRTCLEVKEKKPEYPLLGRIPHLEQNSGGE